MSYIHPGSPWNNRLPIKAIEDKMTTAADKRDENIKKMLERLREHVRTTNILGYPEIFKILI